MTKRSLADLIAHADELADKFETYEPTEDDFDAPLPPLMAVKLAAFRRAAAEKELAEAITAARAGPPVLAATRRSHRHHRRSRPATLRSLLTWPPRAPPVLFPAARPARIDTVWRPSPVPRPSLLARR